MPTELFSYDFSHAYSKLNLRLFEVNMAKKSFILEYKSDLANPYNPKICTDYPTFFVNKLDQKISQSN